MSEAKQNIIKGGYYIKARKIQESAIAHAAPSVREIWDYLLMTCNHSEQTASGRKILRGQTVRTYKDIQDALSWHVGYRKESYSKHDIENALKYLTKHRMISKSKTTRGIVVTICKYSTYQDPKNYENHSESHNGATIEPQCGDTINKNDNNVINNTNNKEEVLAKPNLEEVVDFFTSQGFPDLWGKKFFYFYDAQGWMTSGEHGLPIRNWKSKAMEWLLSPAKFKKFFEVEENGTNKRNGKSGRGYVTAEEVRDDLKELY
jgi:hypothetical protein